MKIFTCFFTLATLALACNQEKDIHIAEIKRFYFQNCSICHSARTSINESTSIADFNKMDSVYLINKLQDLKKTKGHYDYFDSLEYSQKDATLIYDYIKNFFGVRN